MDLWQITVQLTIYFYYFHPLTSGCTPEDVDDDQIIKRIPRCKIRSGALLKGNSKATALANIFIAMQLIDPP